MAERIEIPEAAARKAVQLGIDAEAAQRQASTYLAGLLDALGIDPARVVQVNDDPPFIELRAVEEATDEEPDESP